jgi:hypothetical protein
LSFLDKSDIKANDWVVTTAFYSALHYCQVGLFPCDYYIDPELKELSHYLNFESFYNDFKNSSNQRKHSTPHQCRNWLIQTQVDEIRFEYKLLFDLCHTARYKNYTISEHDKNSAIEYLNSIKCFCDEFKL